MSANVRPNGAFRMIIVDRLIVLMTRRRRSKWWTMTCGCPASRRRKDGTCKHQRALVELLEPGVAARTRLDPIQMGAPRHGPKSTQRGGRPDVTASIDPESLPAAGVVSATAPAARSERQGER